MSARKISIDCYRELVASGKLGAQESRVLAYVGSHPFCTRREIARALKIQTGTVSARVKGLIDALLIREMGTKRCDVSDKRVNALEVLPIQRELFAA